MQDLTGLTAGMSISESTEPTSPGIAVPEDVAHSILLQLDTQDYSTIFTILTCRLVSRSFDAAANSASVWRPLVQQRWTTGEPEHTILPKASDQSLMDLAIDPLDPPVHPRAVFRARTLVDRIALQAAARRGDSVEKQGRIESYDTIAMLGTQVYDAIIRFKTVSPEERHDYLSIRRVAHELEPTLTRGISMELWRNAYDMERSKTVTLDAMYKSLAPFGTPWKTFDAIESGLQHLTDFCYHHLELDQASASAQGVNIPLPHLVAASVWYSLESLGYKVLPSEEVTEENTYPSSSCHLSALLDVESFQQLSAGDPPEQRIPEITAAILISAVLERLPAPYTMKTRLHFGVFPRVALALKDDPPGNERWFHCFVSGGIKEESEIERLLEGEPEPDEARRHVLDPYLPSDVCLSMAMSLMMSGEVAQDGNRRVLSSSAISATFAFLPSLIITSARNNDSGFPTQVPIKDILRNIFRLYPNDAFLTRKHGCSGGQEGFATRSSFRLI